MLGRGQEQLAVPEAVRESLAGDEQLHPDQWVCARPRELISGIVVPRRV
jgi:hypothetical protein